jgi:CheY-like chemotaxis protein
VLLEHTRSELAVVLLCTRGATPHGGTRPGQATTAGLLLELELDGAEQLADAMMHAWMGRSLPEAPNERAELVDGALGELANRLVARAAGSLGAGWQLASPRVLRAAGHRLFASSRAVRLVPVDVGRASFSLGLFFGPTVAESESGSVQEGQRPALRAILADDSALVRLLLRERLQEVGLEVVGDAANGQQLVELFRATRPDVVVLDVHMPVLDGLAAAQIVRAEDPTARIVMCSAARDPVTIQQCYEAGAVAFVGKPFGTDALLEAVRGQPSSSPPRPSLRPIRLPEGTEPPATMPRRLGIYRVLSLLAVGGMAEIYRGEDPGLGRPVAIKVLKDELAHELECVVGFLAEARAAARVSHPHVVHIYAAGSDAGKHFFVMELLPGPSLDERVVQSGPVPLSEALTLVQAAARGLAAAQAQGLVHCDVKPSNLIMGNDGVLKIVDFGIARRIGQAAPTLAAGTPEFAAPEQITGDKVDHRADIYSLGATFYFLAAGRCPYEDPDPTRLALRQLLDPVPVLPGAPARLNAILARMMAKVPVDRYPDYDELIGDLEIGATEP